MDVCQVVPVADAVFDIKGVVVDDFHQIFFVPVIFYYT